ncbi:aldo/keto reductase [Candidatus Bathyarchaeota archaeon]|nr:MAG: aldo/keto reductase [Candidatus Bathyarchaeota archaeon]
MGEGETADYSRDDQDVLTLQNSIELGFTQIDTAEYYGSGHCEEIVGRAVMPFDRNDLFITTKVWHNQLKYDDLVQSMKGSLRRLKLDYVDLYLVHWPNENVPLEETMRALEYCVDEGYTRFIGVSNFPINLMEKAQSCLKENMLVANQVKYSLAEQEPNTKLIPYCVENDVTLIAYTPLSRGSLAIPGNHVLDELTEKYEKTYAQISLNWLISQEKVVAIPKASTLEHTHENLGAVGWRLNNVDSLRLAQSFR